MALLLSEFMGGAGVLIKSKLPASAANPKATPALTGTTLSNSNASSRKYTGSISAVILVKLLIIA